MAFDCQKIMGNLTYTSIKACIKLKKHISILYQSPINHFLIITLSQAWDVASHLLNLELNLLASCLLMCVIHVIHFGLQLSLFRRRQWSELESAMILTDEKGGS